MLHVPMDTVKCLVKLTLPQRMTMNKIYLKKRLNVSMKNLSCRNMKSQDLREK